MIQNTHRAVAIIRAHFFLLVHIPEIHVSREVTKASKAKEATMRSPADRVAVGFAEIEYRFRLQVVKSRDRRHGAADDDKPLGNR